MPSVSPAQHRWIGWLHSDPKARARSGMSAQQVSEWLHADKGSPWKRRAAGGPTSGGMMGMAPLGNPMMQGAYQQFSALPAEKLQELAVRLPPNSPQGFMVRRALQMKHMAPQSDVGMLPTANQNQPPPDQPAPPEQGQPQQQARGGEVHRQVGGMLGIPMGQASPWWERAEERGMDSNYLHGATMGRSDHLTTTAPGGAYVLPADVIAGMGEGNSLAGARVVQEMLRSGPYGTPLSGSRRGSGAPRPPRPVPATEREQQQYQAKGGGVQGQAQQPGEPVPVKLSDGEMVIGPKDVLRFGQAILKRHGGKGANVKLAMKLGHKFFDEVVKHERQKHIDKLKQLPGPAQ